MGYGFQTPPVVADRMMVIAAEDAVSQAPLSVLEPCSGLGSLVVAARHAFPKARVDSFELDADYCREQQRLVGDVVQADFFQLPTPAEKYDLVVANPPHSPMLQGYEMMDRLATFSDRIVVIMPWLWLINSQARHETWRPHIRRAVQLPRSTFPGARIQTAIFDVDLSRRFEYTLYT